MANQSHPRLWITSADIPRLQGWANDANPIWVAGLKRLGTEALSSVQTLTSVSSTWMDSGGTPGEVYAELFAFLSLVSTDATTKQHYATLAHDLVMAAINEAAQGPGTSAVRTASYPTDDRSRWYGEGIPLAVDWVYSTFSAVEKQQIHDVFVSWCNAIDVASVTTDNHPIPTGVINDPSLISDPIRVRWAGNNYYAAHLRNMGLMAMALDPADDTDGKLNAHLSSALGAWLYVVHALYTGDARGGLFVEGFEYGPQTLGYVAQLLLALQTAGQLDTTWGPGVTLATDRFWDDLMIAIPSILSPNTISVDYRGALYQPAWYGDCQHFLAPDTIDVVAPAGLLGQQLGKTSRLDAARFITKEYGPGGPSAIGSRAHDTIYFRHAILYFLLFDPNAVIPNLLSSLPNQWLVEGHNRFYARTSWDKSATWISFGCGWTSIDHQTADALDFSFYRKGEFLTKRRSGYGLDIGLCDNMNTLALQNNQPQHNSGYRGNIWLHGSQWCEGLASGDGKIKKHSTGSYWTYVLGNATPLYNSSYEGSTAVSYVNRSFVWLSPDYIVIYDRAGSDQNLFKRFWLQLPQTPVINNNRAIATTPNGQQIIITCLLPSNAVLTTDMGDAAANAQVAELEPMHARFCSTDSVASQHARWLHVLQGADAGVAPEQPILVTATGGSHGRFDGAIVGNIVVLFPYEVYGSFTSISYTVPSSVQHHLIVGLAVNANFTATITQINGSAHVVVSHGGTLQSDSGGVLSF